jgi:hypothetical protein
MISGSESKNLPVKGCFTQETNEWQKKTTQKLI